MIKLLVSAIIYVRLRGCVIVSNVKQAAHYDAIAARLNYDYRYRFWNSRSIATSIVTRSNTNECFVQFVHSYNFDLKIANKIWRFLLYIRDSYFREIFRSDWFIYCLYARDSINALTFTRSKIVRFFYSHICIVSEYLCIRSVDYSKIRQWCLYNWSGKLERFHVRRKY